VTVNSYLLDSFNHGEQRDINQSIYHSKHICIAPYVANESEAHNGRD